MLYVVQPSSVRSPITFSSMQFGFLSVSASQREPTMFAPHQCSDHARFPVSYLIHVQCVC